MEKAIFADRLRQACELAIAGARQCIIQDVPSRYQLVVVPNASCDSSTADAEVSCPEESPPTDEFLGPMEATEFVDRFWRDGRVPEWVDVSVVGVLENVAHVEALICGRFTASDARLYHQGGGLPPFHVLSPSLPPGHDPASSEKFDLNWRRATRDRHSSRTE